MKPDHLHQLWEQIETTPTHRLLRLKQDVLADLLIQKLSAQQKLTKNEEAEVRDYIDSKMGLIQDLAQLRQGTYCVLSAYA